MAVRNVKAVALPLVVRAVAAGSLLGVCIGACITAVSAIQHALHPGEFGPGGANAGLFLFLALIGLVVGAVAGLATCTGAVAALWIEATTSPSDLLPRAHTAGLGAGAMTAAYTIIVFHALGATAVVLAGFVAGLATVSGLSAAFLTRRLVRRYSSTGLQVIVLRPSQEILGL